MADLGDRAVVQEDFDDIETDFDARIFQEAEVIECALREEATLAGIDARRRTQPVFAGARFDFDEDEAISVAKDEINFAAG